MKAALPQSLHPFFPLLSQLLPEGDVLLYPDANALYAAPADVVLLPQEDLPAAMALRSNGYDGEILFAGPDGIAAPALVQARPIAYLPKTADITALRAALERCQAYQRHPSRAYTLHTRDSVKYIPHSDILYFSSSGHHAFIHTANSGEPFSHLRKLDDIADGVAGSCFVRCHQRYLVNLDHVVLLDRQASLMQLDDGTQIPVSKRYYGATVDSVHAYCRLS